MSVGRRKDGEANMQNAVLMSGENSFGTDVPMTNRVNTNRKKINDKNIHKWMRNEAKNEY